MCGLDIVSKVISYLGLTGPTLKNYQACMMTLRSLVLLHSMVQV